MARSNAVERGLLDTSVFIAQEAHRTIGSLPSSVAVSVITIAELHLGVLMAGRPEARRARLRTLTWVQRLFEALPIDSEVARTFAEMSAEARRLGRRPRIMDTWIAATAAANNLPVYTQDDDFMAIPLVRVFKV